MQRAITLSLFSLLMALLSGCKLAVMVSSGGYVQSLSGTQNCHGPNYCEIDISEADFSETFTAVARADVHSRQMGSTLSTEKPAQAVPFPSLRLFT